MFLARITRRVTSTLRHEAYRGKKVFVVEPVDPDGSVCGDEWVAVDCVGAGPGDIVVCGSAPGVAKNIFKVNRAPIRTIIIAIVDSLDYRDIGRHEKP